MQAAVAKEIVGGALDCVDETGKALATGNGGDMTLATSFVCMKLKGRHSSVVQTASATT